MQNEFKSNSDDPDPDGVYCVYMDQDETYDILLFGNGRNIYEDDQYSNRNFITSLQWLSLQIVNNNNRISYVIAIDEYKTHQFQNTFVDETFKSCFYCKFGFIKWKHYLILFGGSVNDKPIDSIFYFDLSQMEWHKSAKVL